MTPGVEAFYALRRRLMIPGGGGLLSIAIAGFGLGFCSLSIYESVSQSLFGLSIWNCAGCWYVGDGGLIAGVLIYGDFVDRVLVSGGSGWDLGIVSMTLSIGNSPSGKMGEEVLDSGLFRRNLWLFHLLRWCLGVWIILIGWHVSVHTLCWTRGDWWTGLV